MTDYLFIVITAGSNIIMVVFFIARMLGKINHLETMTVNHITDCGKKEERINIKLDSLIAQTAYAKGVRHGTGIKED